VCASCSVGTASRDVGGSIRSSRVIEVLDRLVAERGAPKTLRSDNGPEFVSLAVLGWLSRSGVKSAFIAPGKHRTMATRIQRGPASFVHRLLDPGGLCPPEPFNP